MVAVVSEDHTYIEVVPTDKEGRKRARELSDIWPEIHYQLIRCSHSSSNPNVPDFSEYDILEEFHG